MAVLTAAVIKKQSEKEESSFYTGTCRLKWVTILLAGMETGRYSRKVTKIDEDSPANMVLFAKWTKNIDNHYNVENVFLSDRHDS